VDDAMTNARAVPEDAPPPCPLNAFFQAILPRFDRELERIRRA